MNLPRRGSDWGRIVGVVVLSLFLYYLNVLFFLFLVPLQVAHVRRGRDDFTVASVLTLVGIGLLSLWRASQLGAQDSTALFVGVELGTSFAFMLGIYLLNVDSRVFARRLYRMLLATGIAGVLSVPAMILLAHSSRFSTLLHDQIQSVLKLIEASLSAGGSSNGGVTFPSAARVTEIIRQEIFKNYVFGYFLILAAVWRISTMFTYRIRSSRPLPLVFFTVPEQLLWPVLGAWALVLAARTFHVPVLGYIGWNLGMIGAFLYALQGVGIVQFLFARFRIARGIRVLIVIGLILLLFWPGVGLIVLVALPVLGISELGIRFGRGQIRKEDSD